MVTAINKFGSTSRPCTELRIDKNSILLNATTSTNFIYKIRNKFFSNSEINFINSINTGNRYKDRINFILSNGGKFSFSGMENDIFKLNLQMIDSKIHIILSSMVLNYYMGNANNLIDLLKIVEQENPCNFNLDYKHDIYKYKIKSLLTYIALGMMPTLACQGYHDATRKYIVVKESGNISCNQIYNRKELEDYLLKNTKLDTPSYRNKFGMLYRKGRNIYMKLNLQIRFTE